MGFVGGDRPERASLLPPDVRDWLPAGHLAWALRDLAGQMDLTPFTAWYRADGQGRPAYDPAVMVTLIPAERGTSAFVIEIIPVGAFPPYRPGPSLRALLDPAPAPPRPHVQ